MAINSVSYLTELHQLLNQYFSLEEIKTLCFNLDVDYESVPGDEKPSRIRELLLALGRNDRLPELIAMLRQERPNVEWPPVPDDFKLPKSLVTGETVVSSNQYHVYGDMIHGDAIGGDKILGNKIVAETYIASQVIVSGSKISDIEDLPPEPCDPPCAPPYQGLRSFDFDDYKRFFGRESLTAQLVNQLHDINFLVVVGASGSGKSSVVRAGVIPAILGLCPLEDGSEPPPGNWHTLIMTPTAWPLSKLTVTMYPEEKAAQSQMYSQLAEEKSATALTQAITELYLTDTTNKLLLVVDQFEELLTLCKDVAKRQLLVDNLLTAAHRLSKVHIIVILRADFYSQAIQLDGLEKKFEQQQVIVRQIQSEGLADAILKPAQMGNWKLQAGLTEQILADVGREPGALPLLSHALLATWEQRRGRIMTLSGYMEAGGVKAAIARTATQTFEKLTPIQRETTKHIFLRLTELGLETLVTRRRVSLTEMGKNETVRLVLRKLADNRLLTIDKDMVEVAHEALIREWPLLRHWIDESRDSWYRHRQLTEDANIWHSSGRDTSFLYHGQRLRITTLWLTEQDPPLNILEKTFIRSSIYARRVNTVRQISIFSSLIFLPLLTIFLLLFFFQLGPFAPPVIQWNSVNSTARLSISEVAFGTVTGEAYIGLESDVEGPILLYTSDYGETTHNLNIEGNLVSGIEIDATQPDRVFVATFDGALYRQDGLNIWTPLHAQLPESSISSLLLTPDGTLYVGYDCFSAEECAPSSIMYSHNYGESWEPVYDAPMEILSLLWANDSLFVGTGTGLWQWEASEQTWTNLVSDSFVETIIDNNGILYFSGPNLRRLNHGQEPVLFAEESLLGMTTIPQKSDYLLGTTDDGIVLHWTDAVESLDIFARSVDLGGAAYANFIGFWPGERSLLWVGTDKGLYSADLTEWLESN